MRSDPSWLELDRVLSAILSIPHRELSRDQTSVGCSEHFTVQTAERSVFCRLFRTFLVANSREIKLLSAFRYSRYPQQPTSISITLSSGTAKEEPPQKSRRSFLIVDNLVLDKFGLSDFFEKVFWIRFWLLNNFLYIAIVSSNVGVNGFPGAQASIMAFLDR